MLKSSRRISCIFVIAVLFFVAAFFNVANTSALSEIELILSGEAYNYLPDSAKDFIRENYKVSGFVIPTEKNRQSGNLYLNPEYVDYLEMSEENRQKLEVIPMAYLIAEIDENEPTLKTMRKSGDPETLNVTEANDYISKDDTFPATYDLRDINGNTYITPLKNQGSFGLCWDFAFNEQAESYLMVQSGTPYNANTTQMFSIRQLDYATSTNGLNNYINTDGSRLLTKGGNYYMASLMAANGLAFVTDSYMPYNTTDTSLKEMADIFNYSNSLYELNRGVMLPKSALPHNDYIKYAKSGIMRYGGAEVSTGSPSGTCSSAFNGSRLIYDESSCAGVEGFGAHSMQIIGWNDNLSYSFCRVGTSHTATNWNGGCNEGTLVTGTGVWIIRNSWGVRSDGQDYIYIAYDSSRSNMQINFTTDLTPMSERKWDNNYHINHWYNNSGMSGYVDQTTVTRKTAGAEKLELIKFLPYSYNGNYRITVDDGNTVRTVYEGTIQWPGVHTIDVSAQDIVLDVDSYTVKVTNLNSKAMILGTVQVFTSNVDSTPRLSTDDIDINIGLIPSNSTHNLTVFTDTKNIPSNATPTYYLYEGDNDITNGNLTVTYNKVGANKINAYVFVNTNIGSGDFILKICYQDSCSESAIEIAGITVGGGTGVYGDPYLITKESEFSAVRAYPDAIFELGNDIELTKPFTPIGTADNPFTGTFSGNDYTITNLNVDADGECVGMFGYVEGLADGSSYTPVGFINLINPTIRGTGNAGLVGCLHIPLNSGVSIKNINIFGGTIESTSGSAGAIVGRTTFVENASIVNTQNVFSSADVSGQTSTGLFGSVGPYGGMTLKWVQNAGTVTAKPDSQGEYTEYHNQIIGKEDNTEITLSNYVTSALIKRGRNFDNDIIDAAGSHNTPAFKNYWTATTPPEGVERTPILKKAAAKNLFEFSVIDTDITIKKGEIVSLMDYITPRMDAARVTYEVTDNTDGAVEVIDEKNSDNNYYPEDIKITGLKPGTATLHLKLQYDGNERDMTIDVVGAVVDESDDVIEEYSDGVIVMEQGVYSDVTSRLSMSNGAAVTYAHFDVNGESAGYSVIKTGDVVRMSVDETWYYDFTMVVLGDVDGDGGINSADYIRIKNHIMETDILTGSSPGYIAADWNRDETISSLDYIKVRKYIMNGGNI